MTAPTATLRPAALDATEPMPPASRSFVAAGCWVALVAGAALWGAASIDAGKPLFLDAPPLFARADFSVGIGIVAAVLIAVGTIAFGPRLAVRLSWRRLLWAAVALAAAWAVALVFVRAGGSIARPLEASPDFLHDLPLVAGPGELLRSFVGDIDAFGTHSRAHPPGMLLMLWTLDRAGLRGSGPAAALVIAAGVSAVPAAMIAARAVAGELFARRAAPFLSLTPAAIWIATSADAFFLGVAAWAVALIVLGITGNGRRGTVFAVAGGALFGGALMLSYGLALLALLPAAVAMAWRRWRATLAAGAATLAVLVGFALAGFFWPEGLLATRREYLGSPAFARPYSYFLIGSLAAFAIAVGPAVAAGLAGIRGRAALLAGGAVGAVLLADLSGMSKGEVERIWLPFVPWVVLAAGTIRRRAGAWLAAQGGVALVVAIGFRTPW